MEIFCGPGTPVLDEFYACTTNTLQDIVECEVTLDADCTSTISLSQAQATCVLSTSVWCASSTTVVVASSHTKVNATVSGTSTVTTYSLPPMMVTTKPFPGNHMLVTPTSAGGQATCQASILSGNQPARPLSPVSDDEDRGSKRKSNPEYPEPKKLSRGMVVDSRDVRLMIDDLSRNVASNHQDVLRKMGRAATCRA